MPYKSKHDRDKKRKLSRAQEALRQQVLIAIDPTVEEIRVACEKIRATWTRRTLEKRSVAKSYAVELEPICPNPPGKPFGRKIVRETSNRSIG